jgi:hypothetical protein
LPHGRDQLVRIAGGEMHRADHGVMVLDDGGEPGDVIRVGLRGRDARQRRDFLRMARDRRHGMPAARQFGEDARTGIAGGANQGDFHGVLHFMGTTYVVTIRYQLIDRNTAVKKAPSRKLVTSRKLPRNCQGDCP